MIKQFKHIAVLITSYNRKDKTLACLDSLFNAYEDYRNSFRLIVYLTDDNSPDQTGLFVLEKFKKENIVLLKGSGFLFWAGGMRNSWNEALKEKYDCYLLLNDDTLVDKNLFIELLDTHLYSLEFYKSPGIYIGSTLDQSNTASYGGSIITNYWKNTKTRVIPNSKYPQKVDLGNANIMFVTKYVVDKIGILSKEYTHSIADYDYSLLAKKNRIPVLITSNFCGKCERDHSLNYENFSKSPIYNRIKFINSPLGFAFKDYLIYIKRYFWYRLPLVFIAGLIKIIFPSVYSYANKLIGR